MKCFELKLKHEDYIFLFATVAKVESSWRKYAIRFEKKVFEQIDIKEHKLKSEGKLYSIDTIKACLATSYGLPQIMGYNIARIYYGTVDWQVYGVDLIRFILEYYLSNEHLQFDYFCYFITRFLELTSNDVREIVENIRTKKIGKSLFSFAKRYNGSYEYANLLCQAEISLNKFYQKFPILKPIQDYL